jgi:hypothetical protein
MRSLRTCCLRSGCAAPGHGDGQVVTAVVRRWIHNWAVSAVERVCEGGGVYAEMIGCPGDSAGTAADANPANTAVFTARQSEPTLSAACTRCCFGGCRRAGSPRSPGCARVGRGVTGSDAAPPSGRVRLSVPGAYQRRVRRRSGATGLCFPRTSPLTEYRPHRADAWHRHWYALWGGWKRLGADDLERVGRQ